MQSDLGLLIVTAASIGFIHTLFGPDHYLPFIVISRARKWTISKTIGITTICGVIHVISSVILGLVGISIGVAVTKLEIIEASRGEVAAWLLILFGIVYTIWGIYKSRKKDKHNHIHFPGQKETKKSWKELTPWLLFVIFFFGPCEPLIPILMYPAASESLTAIILVVLAFGGITILTMNAVVLLSLYGIRFLPKISIERYLHAIAGFTIFLCGVGIQFLGL